MNHRRTDHIASLLRQQDALEPHSMERFTVPVPDPATFLALATHALHCAAASDSEQMVIFADSETAHHIDVPDQVLASAKNLVVFGPPPAAWAASGKVTPRPDAGFLSNQDSMIAAASPHFRFALAANSDRRTGYRGAFMTHPAHVQSILEACLGGPDSRLSLPEPASDIAEGSLTICASLMAFLTQRFPLEQDDIDVDKHDLLSVLDILKAVSSKRRSHDVLFVFVEKIARVIEMTRCSVVRIWGDDRIAHVLASHDDERISDLRLDLDKYPEVQHSLDTLGKVVISDVFHDSLTKPFAEDLRRADIRSLMVVPIMLLDPNVGSLFLRAARKNRPFTQREVSFCEIVAEAASNALERAQLFESIQSANKRLEFLAVTDGLTGLFNHRHFRQRLDEEFERARRYQLPLSCIIFDIDDFKKINDTFGHLQGDQILQEIASRTMKLIRRSDIAARYGGEEFTIIMPQTGIEGARSQGQRMLEELRAGHYRGMPPDYPVTVSVGVAVLDHDNMLDCETLIRAADTALYEAKRNGKNQVVVGNVTKGKPS